MTLDCWNQICANRSVFSELFKQYKVPFGVVDEMHQMNPHIVLAALVHLEEAIMFFDPAQQIDMSNLVSQDDSDGRRLQDLCHEKYTPQVFEYNSSSITFAKILNLQGRSYP